jgi:hypothetical protein
MTSARRWQCGARRSTRSRPAATCRRSVWPSPSRAPSARPSRRYRPETFPRKCECRGQPGKDAGSRNSSAAVGKRRLLRPSSGWTAVTSGLAARLPLRRLPRPDEPDTHVSGRSKAFEPRPRAGSHAFVVVRDYPRQRRTRRAAEANGGSARRQLSAIWVVSAEAPRPPRATALLTRPQPRRRNPRAAAEARRPRCRSSPAGRPLPAAGAGCLAPDVSPICVPPRRRVFGGSVWA